MKVLLCLVFDFYYTPSLVAEKMKERKRNELWVYFIFKKKLFTVIYSFLSE